MDNDEYLEWESHQEIRHEYCDGEVLAMAGGTKDHDELAFNLRRLLIDKNASDGVRAECGCIFLIEKAIASLSPA